MLFPRLCDHLLLEGSKGCDLAVVDGEFSECHQHLHPHSFDGLCETLDFAGVAIVDVSRLSRGHLPFRPQHLDAVILDAVSSTADAVRWTLEFETLWKVPVLGWMPEVAPLRAIAEALPDATRPSQQLCQELGNALMPHCHDEMLCDIAHRCRTRNADTVALPHAMGNVTIAVGIDEAMSRHFPENLELLASRGAKLIDFSPLRSSELPRGTEVVYLADGCLHQFADAIAKRSCLFASLQSHVAAGGWIYAEGLGAAMLGQEVELPNQRRIPMAGVLPWSYRLHEATQPRALQEVQIASDNWLTEGCSRLRGYEGCARLEIVMSSDDQHSMPHTPTIAAWRGAVASTLPLFFPAHPRLVHNVLNVNARALQLATR
jgi:cobyrinic acid a,c-diamide synthase